MRPPATGISFLTRALLGAARWLPRGGGRLAGLALRNAGGLVEVEAGPLRLTLDLGDRVQRLMYAGVYERRLLVFLAGQIRAGDTFLDIGAHVGWVSARMLGRVGPSGQILAFEPRPDHFCRIAELAQRADDVGHRLLPFNLALGAERGTTLLYCGAENSGFNTTVGAFTRDALTPTSTPVNLERLDQVLDGVFENAWKEDADSETARKANADARVALAKIDVEGAEIGVLRGARRWLSDQRIERLYLELSPQGAQAQGEERDAAAQILRGHGYEGLRVKAGRLRPLRVADFAEWTFDSFWRRAGV